MNSLLHLGPVTEFIAKVGPGTWPDWVAAIGTSLAFLIAARSYRKSVKDAHQAQARLVYSYVADVEHLQQGDQTKVQPGLMVGSELDLGRMSSDPDNRTILFVASNIVALTVAVKNGSKELIGPVNIHVLDTGRGERIEELSLLLTFVDPESVVERTIYFVNSIHPAQQSLGVSIAFKDSSRNWWSRERWEPVQSAPWDPGNESDSDYLREAARQNCVVMGIEPSPVPRIPIRVRFRRRIRKWRGLHAVP